MSVVPFDSIRAYHLQQIQPPTITRPSPFSVFAAHGINVGGKRGLPTESSDLLSVLDQLDLDTLANSGVGLLSLNTDLFEDDTLGVRSTTEGRGLVGCTEQALLVVKIGPTVLTAGVRELARGVKTTRLSLTHLGGLCSKDGL